MFTCELISTLLPSLFVPPLLPVFLAPLSLVTVYASLITLLYLACFSLGGLKARIPTKLRIQSYHSNADQVTLPTGFTAL